MRPTAGAAPAVLAGVGAALAPLSAALARRRGVKPLHPRGVVLVGELRVDGSDTGVAWVDLRRHSPVVVRLSRSAGLPAPWPDMFGLALREELAGQTCDVLLSTSGAPPLLRHLMRPRMRANGGLYSSVAPYRSPRGPLMVAALPDPRRLLPRSLPDLGAALASEPTVLRMAYATPLGSWRTFASLALAGPPARPDEILTFDALRNAPHGLVPYAWATALREPSYAAARAATGRVAPHAGDDGGR